MVSGGDSARRGKAEISGSLARAFLGESPRHERGFIACVHLRPRSEQASIQINKTGGAYGDGVRTGGRHPLDNTKQ